MSGRWAGVATQMEAVELQALFLHCHGYLLNLAASDAVKGRSVMRNALDITFEVSKLVKFFPKHGGIFES